MDELLRRESIFCFPVFEPGEETVEGYNSAQFLVVGAGGLGCEILKNLALCGIKNIFVIDLDTIELSNLNRQFLFRQKDIGRYKAEVAAEFIKKKYPDINIKFSNRKVQEFTDDFFRQFHIIIGGLDNIQARSYLNKKVHELVEYDENGNIDESTVIPFIDGGTEGFRGQTRVIIPYKTSCFDCTKNMNEDNRKTFAMCTIAENPRVPEHCIEYAFAIEWKKHFERPVDKDSIEDVTWIYNTAKERAEKYKIEGVTYNLTLGVIKNVIPAIASTNALIAASTVLEALKIFVGFSLRLDNYWMYMGHEGLYTTSIAVEKIPNCECCSKKVEIIRTQENKTFNEIFEVFIKKARILPNGNWTIFHNNQIIINLKTKLDSTMELDEMTNPLENLSEEFFFNKSETIKELINKKILDLNKIFEIYPDEERKDVRKIRIKLPEEE